MSVIVIYFINFAVCCVLGILGSPIDARTNTRNDIFASLLEKKITENRERKGNLHGHIVSVNEAHEDASRAFKNIIPVEEEIVAVNEDARTSPGCSLFEGDLCLDPEDEAFIKQGILKRNVMTDKNKLWSDAIIYYSVDSDLKLLRPMINDAIQRFRDRTCLVFREVDTSYKRDHIKMFKGNGCWSKMGHVGGQQLLSLGSGCEYVGVIMHELMHSVGIWHEQSRPDRDQYVEVLWHNIKPGKEKNFMKYEHGKLDALNLPYDHASLMHYDRYLYSVKQTRPTIIARGRPWKKLGGQLRGTLTKNDVRELKALYNC